MCNHELRATPPPLRQPISLRRRGHEIDPSETVDNATRDRAGHAWLAADDAAAAYGSLVAALEITPSTGWVADLEQSNTPTGRQASRFSRLSNLTVRPSGVAPRSQLALRQAACDTAVADDRERIARDLYDKVIHRLFGAGLQLQATCQLVDSEAQTRIETTIDLLDTTITELRKAIFSLH